MNKKLTISPKTGHAMEVTRVFIGNNKLVYVILSEKSLPYEFRKKSKIAYIGTTKKGGDRIAKSVADRAESVLNIHGVKRFYVRVLTCVARRNVKTWEKLERALILGFRELYGDVPVCNGNWRNIKEKDEFDYFKRERIRKILLSLG